MQHDLSFTKSAVREKAVREKSDYNIPWGGRRV